MSDADPTWWARARSLLFVPGSRPERFDNAVAANADAVVVDLEDSVEPADKPAARSAVDSWLGDGRTRVVVRVNDLDSEWASDDLTMVRGRAAVMLPKATTESTSLARQAMPDVPLFALVETPRGVTDLVDLCQVAAPLRLCFGGIDYALAMGVSWPEGPLADDARARIAVASAAYGLPGPFDGVTPNLDDTPGLRDAVVRARVLGFTGKLVIHPRQVEVVHEAFAPTDAELAWARRVVAASGQGVTLVGGQMVDRPVVERALRLLAVADDEGPPAG